MREPVIRLRGDAIVTTASRAAYGQQKPFPSDPRSLPLIETLAIVAPLMLSPGPANLAAFAVASRWGLGRAVPLLLGIGVVYALAAALAAVIGPRLIDSSAGWRTVWQVLGGLFIAYLGWRLARRSRSVQPDTIAPGFGSGVVLQLLNPKYPAVVLAVLANRASEPPLVTAGLIAGVGLVGLVLYASIGAATRRLNAEGPAARWIDRGFGWLLIGTGVWLVLRAGSAG